MLCASECSKEQKITEWVMKCDRLVLLFQTRKRRMQAVGTVSLKVQLKRRDALILYIKKSRKREKNTKEGED